VVNDYDELLHLGKAVRNSLAEPEKGEIIC
jgi:hypothetical protein